MTIRVCIVCVCAVLSAPLFAADEPKPALALVDSTVQLPVDPSRSESVIVVKAEHFPEADIKGKWPTLADVGVPASPAVNVEIDSKAPTVLSETTTSGIWRYKLRAPGLPPYTTQKRSVILRLASTEVTAEYTLSNKPAAAFAWTVLAPPAWHLAQSNALALPVAVTENRATGIRLINSTLERKPQPATIGLDRLQLCVNAVGNCQDPSTIGPFESRALYLRVTNAPERGTYTGNVVIASAEKPQGDPVSLTVYSTSTRAQVGGAAAIAFGVLLLFMTSVLARRKLTKNELLIPAEFLREQLEALLTAARQALHDGPDGGEQQATDAIGTIDAKLTESALIAFLPRGLNGTGRPAELKERLTAVGKEVELMRLVVRDGLPIIRDVWPSAKGDPAKAKIVKDALTSLLALPPSGKSPADTTAEIKKILTKMATDAVVSLGVGAADTAAARLEHIRVSTLRWSGFVYLVWFVATVTTGTLALVLTDPGFGTPIDFAKCVLWGIGLPLAGQQLSQMSVATVGTSFGISLPKAES